MVLLLPLLKSANTLNGSSLSLSSTVPLREATDQDTLGLSQVHG